MGWKKNWQSKNDERRKEKRRDKERIKEKLRLVSEERFTEESIPVVEIQLLIFFKISS